MIATADITPFAGTVGTGFSLGFITGYAIKKVIKLAAVIVGVFIAALAYLEYQRILNIDWERVQAASQNGIGWVVDALTHVSSTIGATHSGTLSNVGIPLASSVSAGFALGLVRG
ncbi:MAG: FUN14 domain-containing protein [Candidatus Nitrosopolaris sp.]